VDIAAYIRDLTAHLFDSYGVSAEMIRLQLEVDEISLGLDTAIPCGLILNELVCNALKHAFPSGTTGAIHIAMRTQAHGMFTLTVSDSGVGFPPEVDFRQTKSLGMQLVTMLAEQLRGTMVLDRRGGTTFTLTFSELIYKERGEHRGASTTPGR
jgi:two-component sensor histidine kinase